MGSIDIGCSKSMCYWCSLYTEELNRQSPDHKIITSASHGKRVNDGWLIPDAAVSARNAVLNTIGLSMDDIFRRICEPPEDKLYTTPRSLESSAGLLDYEDGTRYRPQW